MKCEDFEQLIDEYITNELNDEDRAALEQHLKQCEACNKAYAELKELKNGLKSLAEDLPANFNDELRAKIKKHRLFTNISRFGVSAAAAVVLICAIGIGHSEIYRDGLNEKINAVADVDITTVSDEKAEDITEYVEINKQGVEIADDEAVQQIETESITEAETEAALITKGAEAAVAESTQAMIIVETTNSIEETVQPQTEFAAEVTTNDISAKAEAKVKVASAALEMRNRVMKDDADNCDMDMAESIPAAGITQNSAAKTDVSFVIDSAQLDELANKLNAMDEVDVVEYNDNSILAEVSGATYDALMTQLEDFELTVGDIYIEESVENYSVLFEGK